MRITNVTIREVKAKNEEGKELKLKAYADIVFEECLAIHGLRIIEGKKGIFVAMPSRKMSDGTHKDWVHPINTDLRKEITEIVISKYNEVIK